MSCDCELRLKHVEHLWFPVLALVCWNYRSYRQNNIVVFRRPGGIAMFYFLIAYCTMTRPKITIHDPIRIPCNPRESFRAHLFVNRSQKKPTNLNSFCAINEFGFYWHKESSTTDSFPDSNNLVDIIRSTTLWTSRLIQRVLAITTLERLLVLPRDTATEEWSPTWWTTQHLS